MRRIGTFALAIALIAGCARNPLFYRMGSDYYPVGTIGSQWEYEMADGGTLIVQVVDQTEQGERACYRVLSGADYTYWIPGDDALEFYEDHRVMFNGYEIPLYQAWVTWLDWPLAVGYTRIDSAYTYAVSQGVTISHDWKRTTTVAGIETSPHGGWEQCYHLVQDETVVNWIRTAGFRPETTAVQRNIWLAPGVGMVEMQAPDSTLILMSHTPGN